MKRNKVGLGTFPLVGVFNPIAPKEAGEIVKNFINQGGYYIDSAPLYGNGLVESLLGKVLKDFPRDNYYLITKTIKTVDRKGNLIKSGKYDDVIRGMDYSLERLKLDYVDQLMVHNPVDDTPIEETLQALTDLQKAGKVKEISVSNVNLDELKSYNKSGKIKYVQNRFSLINRSLDKDFEEYLVKNKIYLIPYHLLEIGLLTGIAFENYKLRSGDLREQLPYWNKDNQELIFSWVRNRLSPLAKGMGITIGQLNIAWALSRKFIDFVVVGTTRQSYLSINLAANDIKLSDSLIDEIEKAYIDLESEIKTKFGKSVREFRGLNEKYY